MLDAQKYYSEFPDEEPEQLGRLLFSEELLVTLAAIEKEISAFIHGADQDTARDVATSDWQETS